jgi:hypothetical protein
MAKQVSAEFIALFEQHHNQIAEGHVMNETFVHFADKLLAMLKDDYKKLYELEKKEHEELLAEMRPKTIWPAKSTVPEGFVGGEVTGFGGGAALCSTACGGGQGLTACRCGANRGSDCDCWEDHFREENDVGGAALCATATCGGAALCATATNAEPPVLETLARILESAEPRVTDCALHGPMEEDNDPAKGGARLCHTSNGRGYSLYSPPCNGCRMGQRDAENGLWMSGFAGKTNVFLSVRPEFQEPLHTPPHSPIVPKVPQAPVKPPQGAALCHTPNSRGEYSLFASVGAAAPISPIDQIPDEEGGVKEHF